MAASHRSRSAARWIFWFGLGCYVLALSVVPWLHHDLDCHLKTPTHCDACMASPPGLCSATGAPLDTAPLHDAGGVETLLDTRPLAAFAVETPGRSPPA